MLSIIGSPDKTAFHFKGTGNKNDTFTIFSQWADILITKDVTTY